MTDLYSKALLHNYMLKDISEKEEISNNIISKFTGESHTHQFLMDYELVKESGLKVIKMDRNTYKLSRLLINKLKILKRGDFICEFYPSSTKKRKPFFKIYDFEIN